MGKLSTHVLDTSCGRPAAGMRITLYRQQPDASWLVLTKAITNQDGRVDHPLLEGASLQAGRYCLRFEAGQYFDKQRALLGQSTDAMVASGVASIESSAAKAEPDMAQHSPERHRRGAGQNRPCHCLDLSPAPREEIGRASCRERV